MEVLWLNITLQVLGQKREKSSRYREAVGGDGWWGVTGSGRQTCKLETACFHSMCTGAQCFFFLNIKASERLENDTNAGLFCRVIAAFHAVKYLCDRLIVSVL